jgi:CheY-like chemotaxis protein
LILVSSNNKNNTSDVLVVDDQAITRELLVRAIIAQGYSVDSSASGEEALHLWLNKRHTMVITDCHMPIKDGYQLSKDIREAEKASNLNRTRIIAWTANSKEQELEKCVSAGMDEFLSKPINFSQLKQLLSNIKPSDNTSYSSADSSKQFESLDENIDFTILNQVASDKDSQNKVMNDLLNYIKQDYQLLEQYVVTQNLTKSQDIAHRLKGACKMVGANKVATALAAIENHNALPGANSTQLLHRLSTAITQLELLVSGEAESILAS